MLTSPTRAGAPKMFSMDVGPGRSGTHGGGWNEGEIESEDPSELVLGDTHWVGEELSHRAPLSCRALSQPVEKKARVNLGDGGCESIKGVPQGRKRDNGRG